MAGDPPLSPRQVPGDQPAGQTPGHWRAGLPLAGRPSSSSGPQRRFSGPKGIWATVLSRRAQTQAHTCVASGESRPESPGNRKFPAKCHVTGRARNTEAASACHRPLASGRCACPRVTFFLLIISQPQTAAGAVWRGRVCQGLRATTASPGPLPRLLLLWAALGPAEPSPSRAPLAWAVVTLARAGGPSRPQTWVRTTSL